VARRAALREDASRPPRGRRGRRLPQRARGRPARRALGHPHALLLLPVRWGLGLPGGAAARVRVVPRGHAGPGPRGCGRAHKGAITRARCGPRAGRRPWLGGVQPHDIAVRHARRPRHVRALGARRALAAAGAQGRLPRRARGRPSHLPGLPRGRRGLRAAGRVRRAALGVRAPGRPRHRLDGPVLRGLHVREAAAPPAGAARARAARAARRRRHPLHAVRVPPRARGRGPPVPVRPARAHRPGRPPEEVPRAGEAAARGVRRAARGRAR